MTTMKVYEAVEVLLSRCDGAVSQDGMGFNKFDRNKVDRYVRYEKNYQNEQVLKEVCEKYKNQLGIEKLETEFEKPKYDVIVQESSGELVVKFDYNKEIINRVKKVKGRRYNPKDKNWYIPINQLPKLKIELKDFKVKYDFEESELNEKNGRRIELNSEKIYIYFEYNEDILDNIRSLPDRRWNKQAKRWEAGINLPNLNQILKIAEEYDFSVDQRVFEKKQELENILEKSKAVENGEQIEIEGLNPNLELKPFQKAGVQYATQKKKLFIADEVGLGKTPQSIATIHKDKSYPTLVVCPAFLKYNWEKEYKKWIEEDLDICIIDGRDNEEIPTDCDVYIINYMIIHHNLNLLLSLNLKSLIIDESHYIKNHKAKRTKAIQKIADKKDFEYILLLSATPLKNRPKELISQLNVLGKLEGLGGFWGFANRYCIQQTEWGQDFDGAKNMKELHNRLRTEGFIRRKKEQVMKELPPVNRASIPVEIDNRETYKQAERDIIRWIRENVGTKEALRAMKAEMIVRLGKLRRLSAEGKLSSVEKWVSNFLESSEEKVIVFAHHKSITEKLAEKFDALKITGNTTAEEKNKAVEEFQNNPEKRLIVISLQAGSEGLTLTKAKNIVFVEYGWTPTEHNQAEGRAYGRLNDAHGINSYYFTGVDTIDEYILDMIESKREVVNKTLDGELVDSEKIRDNIVDEVIDNLIK